MKNERRTTEGKEKKRNEEGYDKVTRKGALRKRGRRRQGNEVEDEKKTKKGTQGNEGGKYKESRKGTARKRERRKPGKEKGDKKEARKVTRR